MLHSGRYRGVPRMSKDLLVGFILAVSLFTCVRIAGAQDYQYSYGLGHGAGYIQVHPVYRLIVSLPQAPVPHPLYVNPVLKLSRQKRFGLVPNVLHRTGINTIYGNPLQGGFGLYPTYLIVVPIQ